MAFILSVNGISPVIGKNVFLAPNATIAGDVVIGDCCTVWFNAVVRGDVHSIRIGNNVNIQDGAIIHCTYKKSPVNIGNNVSIAHGAIVHGCTIHDNVLIGMGAIVMDDAIIESNSIVAAGAVISKNAIVKSGTVWGGVPARQIKEIDTELLEGDVLRIANAYNMYASWYAENWETDGKPRNRI
ncbi:MAG TPA: gamma carbonic anhydrase family protein [Bacteroidales bacterium]|jgi:carbonic anhydrase/acetyltransferase-like protein (isoleucine patch superfamily)|nr:gamma carbonic anhydrase family protein [Bacteroidales bacterium]MDI9573267.1 gamma carbonic anhydrase family protein [Bacteroidota bacterium]OQC59294.1 MAG: UDP-3-O-(3-hydroxymyristoyl) glucosamine N-acyltransferase [Bacteroidetes bacterium ADurb.Bin012]MBP9511291.1 gamma carbonic anhydrase family protein [Bacteroidales bacterium]MBP9588972.1 gamma carbonic anhydrase family protein [Bacteroidales bacterium]